MDIIQAIEDRRSIRKFKPEPIPEEILEKILGAGTLAPSGKNKQPWKFYVVQGAKRQEMVEVMMKGINRLENDGVRSGSAKFTRKIMGNAPVTIFVFNPTSKHPLLERHVLEKYADLVDIQSVGAAIQNILLSAMSFGLGSLWICDIFYAYEEFCDWFGEKGQLIAAVSLGYPDQEPAPRPRRMIDEVTVFFD